MFFDVYSVTNISKGVCDVSLIPQLLHINLKKLTV